MVSELIYSENRSGISFSIPENMAVCVVLDLDDTLIPTSEYRNLISTNAHTYVCEEIYVNHDKFLELFDRAYSKCKEDLGIHDPDVVAFNVFESLLDSGYCTASNKEFVIDCMTRAYDDYLGVLSENSGSAKNILDIMSCFNPVILTKGQSFQEKKLNLCGLHDSHYIVAESKTINSIDYAYNMSNGKKQCDDDILYIWVGNWIDVQPMHRFAKFNGLERRDYVIVVIDPDSKQLSEYDVDYVYKNISEFSSDLDAVLESSISAKSRYPPIPIYN